MINRKKFLRLGPVLFCLMIISCGSTPKFEGKGDFCVFVIDEKNQPVNQAVIDCSRNGIEFGKGITNEQGIAVIENISGGNYEVSAYKCGCEKIEKVPVKFSDRSNVFCFEMKSGDALLDEVEFLFRQKKFDEGLDKLEKIHFEDKDPVKSLVCYYRAYGFWSKGDEVAAEKEINKFRKLKGIDVDIEKIYGVKVEK